MIILTENYRIKPDAHCFILESRTIGKNAKGEEREIWTPTYHPSYRSIAAKIVKEESKLANDLDEIEQVMRKTADEIERTIKLVEGK